MKVAIVGFGVEGRSTYRYFADQGADITIFDEKPPSNPPAEAALRIGPFEDISGYDVVVRGSPAIRPDRIRTDGRVTTCTREFLSVFGTGRVIGVTGSKGKGTTTTLIYDMLKAAGKRVHIGGNIGVPALDLLPGIVDGDYAVLELSSFQLWDVEASPHIAVLLMIEPEHLDVHTDVDEYIGTKANIAAYQTEDDILVFLPTNPLTVRAASKAKSRKIPYATAPGAHVEDGFIVIDGQRIIAVGKIGLIGPHNVENACAAVTAAWQVTQDVPAIARALAEFTGLPHRLKLVREVNGVGYYDDSIATTPGSAIAALRSFGQPKVIVLGGSDKGADFTELAAEIKQQNVRAVILIGALQDKIHDTLVKAGIGQSNIHMLGSPSMPRIVQEASEVAQPGDVVIMSPACASFDMFRDYKDRGDQFVAAVEALGQDG